MAYNLNVSFSFLVNGTSLQQGSTIATAREIIKKDGFGRQGLNKGLTSTLGRHGVFNMIYFGFYHNVRDLIPQAEVFKKSNTKAQVIFSVMPYFIQKRITYSQYQYVWTQTFFFLLQTHSLEIGRKLLIGFVSGTIASCVNIPFDVAKSRIQGPQPVPGEIKYRTCFKTIATVFREEG